MVLSIILGGCYGMSATQLFFNNLPLGLGFLAIAVFVSTFYIAAVVTDVGENK
jgi:hypothetical protein